jgi:uroporphyrinogen-III synthase/uroporphyrinogen III methyltransferase/synthase
VPRLDGQTVVVTRGAPAAGDDALGDRLRALGATVVDCPAIVTGPPEDPAPLDQALRALDGFGWAAFASATAVERTVARLDALPVPRGALADLRLACVGPATAERLEALVRAPDLVPMEATGAALAEALARHVRGVRVLVPRAAEGRPELVDGLRAAGAEVVAPAAYRTVPAPPERLAPLLEGLAARTVHAVAFASPSAVQSVLAALGARASLLGGVVLGAIGPTTAEALRRAGFTAGALPVRHTAADLAEALAVALAGRG